MLLVWFNHQIDFDPPVEFFLTYFLLIFGIPNSPLTQQQSTPNQACCVEPCCCLEVYRTSSQQREHEGNNNNKQKPNSSKNTNPRSQTLVLPKTLVSQSITKIQFKDREQPPIEKNTTDLDKEPLDLLRFLVKKVSSYLRVALFSFKVIPKFAKSDYHL